MKKSEIFATIKEANTIVDKMDKYVVGSLEYDEYNQALGWTLDSIIVEQARLGFSLNLSKRTGHYWVKFF